MKPAPQADLRASEAKRMRGGDEPGSGVARGTPPLSDRIPEGTP